MHGTEPVSVKSLVESSVDFVALGRSVRGIFIGDNVIWCIGTALCSIGVFGQRNGVLAWFRAGQFLI